ncbi:MAG: TetR family transcriptional regulator [bacterium]|nr:TetR family transcriptional regulator [bacterium]
MPTERFFRLPQEKQRAIQKAAFREFSRVPLENVSINKIIRDAEISRGSFYTYFEDKRDVLRYLVDQLGREMKGYVLECLRKSGGNIFETYKNILEYIMVHRSMGESSDQLVRNILSTVTEENFSVDGKSIAEQMESNMEDIQQCQGTNSLNTEENKKEYKAVSQILQAVVCQEAGMYFMKIKSKEEAMQDFQVKTEILCRGFQQGKTEN